MQILTMMMMMMMMSFLYSALADQSLECYNDFRNTFTCVWNSSELNVRPETRCSIHVTVLKAKGYVTVKEAHMTADPTQPHIRSATVDFNRERAIIIRHAKLSEEVRCENYTEALANIPQHYAKDSVVKLAPPKIVEVRRLTVNWSFSSPGVFEVQCRSAAQSWTDVSRRPTEETYLELSEDELFLQQQYVIRVRGKFTGLTNAIWSDWSEEYSWTSEVGRTPLTPLTHPPPGVILELDWSVAGLVFSGIILAVSMCVILICCNRNKWLQKNRFLYIPDPSKFFGDLNSHHGGNFTSWLGPILERESFIKVDTEFVSPVEVLKLQDACESRSTHRHSGGLQDGWEGTNKSSNFSNSTYFLSQSSKGPSDTLEPCSPHSSYGPAGGVTGPEAVLQRGADITRGAEEKDRASELEFSLKTLEKLRQDTQSPDSGFAGGNEDSMEESDLPSPLALNLLPHLPPHLPAPHPVMHPLLGFKHTAGLSLIPGLIDLDLQSSCGMLEPSSDDYMPVKNVQN